MAIFATVCVLITVKTNVTKTKSNGGIESCANACAVFIAWIVILDLNGTKNRANVNSMKIQSVALQHLKEGFRTNN